MPQLMPGGDLAARYPVRMAAGVAYNNAIIGTARNIAEEEGFEFIVHTKIPCGDGGISLGQAMIGAMEL